MVKRYATHDYDSVLGMYYAKARFYDAENRRFVAIDPILDPSVYDIKDYVDKPMQLVQYVYVQNNPIIVIDPLGAMPVWMLRGVSSLYNNGLATAEQVTLFTLLMNAFNIGQGFHEIAQLNLAKYLHQKGYYSVTLEDKVAKRQEADITTTSYIWEVKSATQLGLTAPDTQLNGYITATGKKEGFGILRAGIPVIRDIYMGITTSPGHPGIEYYYFYRFDCNNNYQEVRSSVAIKAVQNELLAVATVVGVAAGATILEDLLTAGAGTADDLLSVLGALGTAAKFAFA